MHGRLPLAHGPPGNPPYRLNATEMAATDWAALGSQPERMFIRLNDQDSMHFMAAAGPEQAAGGQRTVEPPACGQLTLRFNAVAHVRPRLRARQTMRPSFANRTDLAAASWPPTCRRVGQPRELPPACEGLPAGPPPHTLPQPRRRHPAHQQRQRQHIGPGEGTEARPWHRETTQVRACLEVKTPHADACRKPAPPVGPRNSLYKFPVLATQPSPQNTPPSLRPPCCSPSQRTRPRPPRHPGSPSPGGARTASRPPRAAPQPPGPPPSAAASCAAPPGCG